MNFRKLLTYLTVSTAAVIPFAGAQNPTILQGSYISNVFGNSNFVKNPNGQTNVANVTNATRSTTTPLVATSEFNLNLTSGTFATWTLRAFDAGMKGQNCEARFSYRGFATATTTAEIVQNSLVVAQLVLTPSTDPRIASINFPCGDLVNATTFRIAQTTANMTIVTPNEIGGIYVGLATNMANVAQAETVVNAKIATDQTVNFNTFVVYGTEEIDINNEYNSTTGIFTASRDGVYQVEASILYDNAAWTAGQSHELQVWFNGVSRGGSRKNVQASATFYADNAIVVTYALQKGQEIKIQALVGGPGITAKTVIAATVFNRLTIKRFPSASELVVTPERQNTWGEISGGGVDSLTTSASYVTPSGFTTYLNGKCLPDGTNMACKISTLPPGAYQVSVSTPYFAEAGSALQGCFLQITDNKGAVDAATAQSAAKTGGLDGVSHVSRIFTYTSVQTDIIFSFKHKQSTGTGGSCGVFTSSGRFFSMLVKPLDQPSNSALYVQGPVLSAGTGTASAAGYQGEEVSGTSTAGTGLECAKVTVNPGQWILYGMAYADMTAIGPTPSMYYYDVEIDDTSGNLGAGTGSFQRGYFNLTSGAVLLSTTRIVRTSAQKIYYLNCRSGTGTKTNNTSVFKAVRLN